MKTVQQSLGIVHALSFLCLLLVGGVGCDGSKNASSSTGTSGTTGSTMSSGGSGGAGAAGGSGATGGSTSVGGSTGGTGGGTTNQPCDPACTGTKLCDGGSQCVCAPGFAVDGSDCAVLPISDPKTRTKEEVCARYAEATVPPPMEWTPGKGGTCDPGTTPFEGQIAALRYLDFYRWMLGIGPVQVLPSVAAAEQQCALMLNYYFGHDPKPDVMCYTPEGAQACGDSLIAGGYGLVGQVDGYALEIAQNLIHRRNVLAVGRAGIWFGVSGGSSDMHYGGAYPALPTDPEFVAHPGPGINVQHLVPSWWFIEKGTKTTPPVDAHVFVKSTMEEKPMKSQHHYNDFSSFQLDGWTPDLDVTYVVRLLDDQKAVFSEYETSFVECP